MDPEILRELAMIYLPIATALYSTAILCLFFFKIDRATHESNLVKLKDAAALAELSGVGDQAGGVPGVAGGAAPIGPRS